MEKISSLKITDILKFEIYKIIHNRWMFISLCVPILMLFAVFAHFWLSDYPAQVFSNSNSSNPYILLSNTLFSTYKFTYPLIIAVICSQYFLIEKQSEGFKLNATIPYATKSFLAIKYLILLLSITLVVFSAYLIFLIGAALSGEFLTINTFAQYNMNLEIAVLFSKLLLYSYAIIIIQYGLNYITNSYIVPIFIPLICMSIYFETQWLDLYHSYGGYLSNIAAEFGIWNSSYKITDSMIFIVPMIVFVLSLFKNNFVKFYFIKK